MSKQGYTRQAKGRPLLKCRQMATTHLMRGFWQYDVFSSKGAWHVACGMRILGMWQHAAVASSLTCSVAVIRGWARACGRGCPCWSCTQGMRISTDT